jgi:hypothetical protein
MNIDSGKETVSSHGVKEEWEGMMGEAEEFAEVTDDPLKPMGAWLAPQYAVEARRRLAEAKDGKERFEVMRAFVRDWAWMRARDQAQARVEMQQFRAEVFEREYFDGVRRKIEHEKRVKEVLEQMAQREREKEGVGTSNTQHPTSNIQ